jgi:outer membrane protein assembly factor BamB
VAVFGLLAAVAAALLIANGPSAPSAGGERVDLPAVVPEGRGLTGEEAASALEPFAEDRLRCRPLGCERWWVARTVESVSPAVLGGDLVVAFHDGVGAIDPETGAERWMAPLASMQPDPRTGWRIRSSELVLSAGDDDLLLWAPRGFLQLRDADGRHRWSVTAPETRRLWSAELAGDVVVVASAEDHEDGAIEVVTAYDRSDGTVRWRERVRWTYDLDPDGALVRTVGDRVSSLDPSTGAVAYELETTDPRWVTSRGAFFVARVAGNETVLLDRATGTIVRTIEDVLGVADLEDGAGGIALLLSGRSEGTTRVPVQVMAIDDDGSTRWTHDVGCCARLVRSPPGTVAARVVGDEPPIVLAAEDGSLLAPPPWDPVDGLRWLSDEVLFAPGPATSLLVDREGRRLAVDGARPRVVSLDPLVVASRAGLLGIHRSVASEALAPAPTMHAGPARWASAPQGTRPVRDRTPRAR